MQPYFLLIETATEICSVALSKGDQIIAVKESDNGFSHAQNLIPFVEEILKESNVDRHSLNAVVLSSGPGSYTGLRIGASSAKGLCYALDIPLISIPTLQSIMLGAKTELPKDNIEEEILFCPMIDARRMEVYTALYAKNGELIEDTSAKIIDENTFKDILEKQVVVFCGNGMPKCKSILETYPNARFSDTPLSSANMAKQALLKYEAKQFEDVAYFEPFYLKEYIAVKSTVKGL